ncbi:flagellar hook-associated protein FlgK [Spongiibacter taiwanensis]|uniref:flagellar hook-associated protein FlgK n=1 Tax=Spongiibacter taiwanensis TaxID=1748242 RepID=UPI00203505CE|nr:flagellar hook-associated protein FlgK [Spongiibacter taiwanensis]USA43777.1 flagellar hook-associated protein FlgK [Spongiibacter taiwanensis]
MGDMLGNSLSALVSYQRAMATSSHNIANADTEGYSRQRVDFSSRTPQQVGNLSIGSGVSLSSVRRVYDEFATSQLRDATAGFNHLDSYYKLAVQLDNVVADPDIGLASSMSRFYNSIQDMADDPSSISSRQLMIAEANSLASRIAELDSQMSSMDKEVNLRISSSVASINDLAAQVAEMNRLISESEGQFGTAANDLLDKRDQAVIQLNELIGIKTVVQDDGALNVFIANGESLVLGQKSTQLAAVRSEFEPDRVELALQKSGGNAVISDIVSGGVLGGVLSFRDGILSEAKSELGRITVTLATTLNEQNQAGMDLNGDMGQALFGISEPQAFRSTANTGNATVTAQITDMGQITGDNVLMRFDGSNWNFYTAGSQVPVTGVTGAGTAADPFVYQGVSFVVSNTPATGDRFLLRPTADAPRHLSVLINDPARIAAAAPTRTRAEPDNAGGASISQTEIIDPSDPALLSDVTIEFTSPTTYSINGSGSFSYVPSANIDINGNRLSINGNPAAGDRFFIGANVGGVGDNRNALKLVATETKGVLNGGTASLQTTLSGLVGDVAVATRSAEVNRQSQQNLLTQTQARQQEISGVNLDEEAANLLKFQQAYQAAAKATSAANDMFQALMAAFR